MGQRSRVFCGEKGDDFSLLTNRLQWRQSTEEVQVVVHAQNFGEEIALFLWTEYRVQSTEEVQVQAQNLGVDIACFLWREGR